MSKKAVKPNQRAIDGLPLNSGTWSVEGCPGLYVRCLTSQRSFFVQRRLHTKLVKVTVGNLPIKEARREAARIFTGMAPRPRGSTTSTLRDALEDYLSRDRLSPRSRIVYRSTAKVCLSGWMDRRLSDIGADRFGVRALQREIADNHGKAQSNLCMNLLSGVYKWARKADPMLPESPTVAIELYRIPPRDWAWSDEGLRGLFKRVREHSPMIQTWWTVALLTGARCGSICALRWGDIDAERRVVRFATAKGGRTYGAPAADLLLEKLEAYRAVAAPSTWVFPSPRRPDSHIKDPVSHRDGITAPHRLRHSYRTTLAALGAPEEAAKILLGHALTGVSGGYVSTGLLIEPLRPWANKVAERYREILGGLV